MSQNLNQNPTSDGNTTKNSNQNQTSDSNTTQNLNPTSDSNTTQNSASSSTASVPEQTNPSVSFTDADFKNLQEALKKKSKAVKYPSLGQDTANILKECALFFGADKKSCTKAQQYWDFLKNKKDVVKNYHVKDNKLQLLPPPSAVAPTTNTTTTTTAATPAPPPLPQRNLDLWSKICPEIRLHMDQNSKRNSELLKAIVENQKDETASQEAKDNEQQINKLNNDLSEKEQEIQKLKIEIEQLKKDDQNGTDAAFIKAKPYYEKCEKLLHQYRAKEVLDNNKKRAAFSELSKLREQAGIAPSSINAATAKTLLSADVVTIPLGNLGSFTVPTAILKTKYKGTGENFDQSAFLQYILVESEKYMDIKQYSPLGGLSGQNLLPWPTEFVDFLVKFVKEMSGFAEDENGEDDESIKEDVIGMCSKKRDGRMQTLSRKKRLGSQIQGNSEEPPAKRAKSDSTAPIDLTTEPAGSQISQNQTINQDMHPSSP